MEQIRSFIAIELPPELKAELSQLEAQLKSSQAPGVKWVDPAGIHLTLKFLGNIASGQTGEIIRVMEEAAQEISYFYLELKDLGVFPNLKRVQVAWVGLGGELDKLSQFQQRLESGLTPLGFPPELRSFTPHLTIARLPNRASADERQRFGQLIATTPFKSASFKVKAINLMRSQLTRAGAIYSHISSVQLKNPLPTTAG